MRLPSFNIVRCRVGLAPPNTSRGGRVKRIDIDIDQVFTYAISPHAQHIHKGNRNTAVVGARVRDLALANNRFGMKPCIQDFVPEPFYGRKETLDSLAHSGFTRNRLLTSKSKTSIVFEKNQECPNVHGIDTIKKFSDPIGIFQSKIPLSHEQSDLSTQQTEA